MTDSPLLVTPSNLFPLPTPPLSSHPLKVIIIGGGLGGLALANGLQCSPFSSSFSFEVFEQGTPDKVQGYQLGIQPEGAAALSLLGCSNVLSLLKEKGVLTTMSVYAAKGEGIENLLSFEVGGDGGVIDRKRLHLMLLSGVRDRVHFGKKLVMYEVRIDSEERRRIIEGGIGEDAREGEGEGEGRITAYFDDGSHCTGDLLIAADGVNSQVRSQLLSAPSHDYTVPLPVSSLSFCLPLSRMNGLPHVHEVLLPNTLLRVLGPSSGCSWLFMVYKHDRVESGEKEGEEEGTEEEAEEEEGEKAREKREEKEGREEAAGEPMLTFVFNHNFEMEGDFAESGDARDWITFMKRKAGDCLPIQELLSVVTKDDVILGGPKHLRSGEKGRMLSLSQTLSSDNFPIAFLGEFTFIRQ